MTRAESWWKDAVIDEIVNGYHYPTPGSNTGWQNYTFHHDQINSVTALSGPNGGVEDQTGFDPFGMITSSTQPGSGNTLLYTGREYDRDTGLYYYRAGYYDPEIGRFISEDPKGFLAGVNFYAYCSSNPINCNDPSGMKPGDWYDPRNYNFVKAAEIAKDVQQESFVLASQRAQPGSQEFYNLVWNGQLDAWRHAEWNRQMAEQLNGPVAVISGVGHEIQGLAEWGGREIVDLWNGTNNNISLSQLLNETYMDLHNNAVGRNDNSGSPINVSNSLLMYGLGGSLGQPDFGLGDYVFTPYSTGAGGGFVIYPNKPNTNIMSQAYKK